MPITEHDFTSGGLRQSSYIRPNRLFTADSHIILYRAGGITPDKLAEVHGVIVQILAA